MYLIPPPDPAHFRWRGKSYFYSVSRIACCGRHSNSNVSVTTQERPGFPPPCCLIDARRRYSRTREWVLFGRTLADVIYAADVQYRVQAELQDVGETA